MELTLSQLREKIAEKPALEAKLRELQEQRRVYDGNVIALRVESRQAREDVEKLEGRSLANYFFQVIGKLDDKLDRERQEAYAARVKLDAAEQELNGVQRDLDAVQRQLFEVRAAQAQYREELEKKQRSLRVSGTPAGERILELEQQLSALEAQEKEIREAITAGYSAKSTADQILSKLDSADSWNTWDLIGGGGIITHMAKHSHLDDAQQLVQELQSRLRRFRTELADIQISADLQVNVDGFLRFADYFFDGLFADWAVGERIGQSQDAVQKVKDQIGRMLTQLQGMEAERARRIKEKKAELDALILES